ARLSEDSTIAVTTRMTTVQAAADKNRRRASELARIGRGEQIAEPTHGLNHVDPKLLADAADEDLYRVAVAVEILVVEVLDQLGARSHAGAVMHEIGQQSVFVRGELDRIALDRDSAGAGIETHRPAVELALGMPGRTAQQGTDSREHLFQVE